MKRARSSTSSPVRVAAAEKLDLTDKAGEVVNEHNENCVKIAIPLECDIVQGKTFKLLPLPANAAAAEAVNLSRTDTLSLSMPSLTLGTDRISAQPAKPPRKRRKPQVTESYGESGGQWPGASTETNDIQTAESSANTSTKQAKKPRTKKTTSNASLGENEESVKKVKSRVRKPKTTSANADTANDRVSATSQQVQQDHTLAPPAATTKTTTTTNTAVIAATAVNNAIRTTTKARQRRRKIIESVLLEYDRAKSYAMAKAQQVRMVTAAKSWDLAAGNDYEDGRLNPYSTSILDAVECQAALENDKHLFEQVRQIDCEYSTMIETRTLDLEKKFVEMRVIHHEWVSKMERERNQKIRELFKHMEKEKEKEKPPEDVVDNSTTVNQEDVMPSTQGFFNTEEEEHVHNEAEHVNNDIQEAVMLDVSRDSINDNRGPS